jgi:hypothetical protein
MELQLSRKQLNATLAILLLVIVSACAYLIREGFWANINSQSMLRLAKEDWANREYISSMD